MCSSARSRSRPPRGGLAPGLSTSMPVTSPGTAARGSDRQEADQRSAGARRQGSPDQDRGRPASPDHRQSALARLHRRPSPDARSGRHCPRRVRPGTSRRGRRRGSRRPYLARRSSANSRGGETADGPAAVGRRLGRRQRHPVACRRPRPSRRRRRPTTDPPGSRSRGRLPRRAGDRRRRGGADRPQHRSPPLGSDSLRPGVLVVDRPVGPYPWPCSRNRAASGVGTARTLRLADPRGAFPSSMSAWATHNRMDSTP